MLNAIQWLKHYLSMFGKWFGGWIRVSTSVEYFILHLLQPISRSGIHLLSPYDPFHHYCWLLNYYYWRSLTDFEYFHVLINIQSVCSHLSRLWYFTQSIFIRMYYEYLNIHEPLMIAVQSCSDVRVLRCMLTQYNIYSHFLSFIDSSCILSWAGALPYGDLHYLLQSVFCLSVCLCGEALGQP